MPAECDFNLIRDADNAVSSLEGTSVVQAHDLCKCGGKGSLVTQESTQAQILPGTGAADSPGVASPGTPLIWVGWDFESFWRICLEDCVIVFVVAFLPSLYGLSFIS